MRDNLLTLIILLVGISCGLKGPFSAQLNTGSAAKAEDQARLGDGTSSSTPDGQKEISSEQNESDKDLDKIIDPVAIGGAFLTCSHNEQQAQNKAEVLLKCKLSGTDPASFSAVDANFRKVDAAGKTFPLSIQSQDAGNLTWTITETSESVFIVDLEARITLNGAGPFLFKYKVTQQYSVAINPIYWLANEPNDNNGEDCAEFVNIAEKVKHQDFYQTATGIYGRMNDRSCIPPAPQAFLCRRIDASAPSKWLVTSTTGNFSNYPSACPAKYIFSVPINEAEVLEVSALVDSLPSNADDEVLYVWVALTDSAQEGKWDIILK